MWTKTIMNLGSFHRMNIGLYCMVAQIKSDTQFNNICNNPEFQLIARDVEAKYQAEHERVRQWLEENEMQ